MDIVYGLVTFLAGLGLLLYSIKLVGEALEKTTGGKFRKKLTSLTDKRVKAAGLGLGITLLLQSSTAAIVMTVALCNAGVMSFLQTIPFIMGVNVGSSISTILVSFGSVKIVQILSVCLFVGAMVFIFTKNETAKNIAKLLIGLGALFLGITLMSSGMSVLIEKGIFNFIASITNPALLILMFLVFTTAIQTSMGATAVLITFLGAGGVMSFASACWALMGINMGTAISSYIATIGASKGAKRAGLLHILYNVIGTIIWSILLIFVPIAKWFTSITSLAGFQVLMFDMLFNISTCCVLLPCTKLLYKLVMKIFPDKKTRGKDTTLRQLDNELFETPTIALGSFMKKSVEIYGKTVNEALKAIKYVTERDETQKALVQRECMEIDTSLKTLEEGLFKISSQLFEKDQTKAKTVLEIIGKNKTIIKSLKKLVYLSGEEVSPTLTQKEKEQIQLLQDKIQLITIASLTAFEVMDLDLVMEREPLVVRVIELENEIANLNLEIRNDSLNKIKDNQKKIQNFAKLTNILSEISFLGECFASISILAS